MGEAARKIARDEYLEIEEVLVLSTGHVRQEDMVLMEERGRDPDCPLCIANYAEGAWLVVPPPEAGLGGVREFGFSESVVKVMEFARWNWVRFVRLDRDGPVLMDNPRLDTHDW